MKFITFKKSPPTVFIKIHVREVCLFCHIRLHVCLYAYVCLLVLLYLCLLTCGCKLIYVSLCLCLFARVCMSSLALFLCAWFFWALHPAIAKIYANKRDHKTRMHVIAMH